MNWQTLSYSAISRQFVDCISSQAHIQNIKLNPTAEFLMHFLKKFFPPAYLFWKTLIILIKNNKVHLLFKDLVKTFLFRKWIFLQKEKMCRFENLDIQGFQVSWNIDQIGLFSNPVQTNLNSTIFGTASSIWLCFSSKASGITSLLFFFLNKINNAHVWKYTKWCIWECNTLPERILYLLV